MCRRRTTRSHLLRALGRGGEGGVGHLLPGGRQEQVEAAMMEVGELGAEAELYWIRSFVQADCLKM